MKALVWAGVLWTTFFAAGLLIRFDRLERFRRHRIGETRYHAGSSRRRVHSNSGAELEPERRRRFATSMSQPTSPRNSYSAACPLVLDTFSAYAYPDACGSVDAGTTVVTWLSDAVAASILARSRNGRAPHDAPTARHRKRLGGLSRRTTDGRGWRLVRRKEVCGLGNMFFGRLRAKLHRLRGWDARRVRGSSNLPGHRRVRWRLGRQRRITRLHGRVPRAAPHDFSRLFGEWKQRREPTRPGLFGE